MKERLIKALDVILIKQHIEVLRRYSEGYGEEAIAEITAKLESGNVRRVAGLLRSDVKDMVKGTPTLVNGLTPY